VSVYLIDLERADTELFIIDTCTALNALPVTVVLGRVEALEEIFLIVVYRFFLWFYMLPYPHPSDPRPSGNSPRE
jgi:hypothetical protein